MSFPNRNTDRISILPDSILCHILSFLPTKQSAATSILSKRWKPLWLSVLTLDFDDQGFYNFSIFRHFVYSVMLMRDTALPIRSFRLKCGILRGCNPHDINRFVCAAVKRGIHSLILDLSRTNEDFQIRLDPTISSVFNCRNLVVLKLKSLRVNFRPQFDFPLLKTLHLDSVYFFGPYVRNNILDKLIEECPILEQFQVTDLRFGLPYLNNWGSRDLEHLVRANISDFKWKVPFARVCSAKFLRFELNTDQQVHTFHNLTHMELIFVQSWKEKRKMLLELLQHCPNLQDLTLHKFYRCEIDEHGWSEPQIVPKCLSSQLRTCSLIDYKGTKCELQFAEYILRNSKVLQTMKISAAAENINMKHQMLMKLSLCPRGSIACKLSFD